MIGDGSDWPSNLFRFMHMDNTPHNDDVAHLFRENGDIGSDSSLWLRPLRQLFKAGKPVGQVLALTVSPTDQLRLPFGLLSQTKRDRVIFWPALPPGVSMICAGEPIDVLDHITLEYPSERTHVTAYDTDGRPVHISRAWKTHHLQDRGLVLWFLLLVRISVLRQQDVAVQRRVQMPIIDKKRRMEEFTGYVQRLKFLTVPLPPHAPEQDYIYLGLYFAPDSAIMVDRFSAPILPANASIDSQIKGWDNGDTFEITGLGLPFGKRTICVAAACPPGRLLSDVSVGLPRKENPRNT